MSKFEKIIKDTEGDTARVVAHGTDNNVDFWTRQALGNIGVYLGLTPKAARSLAKALNKAANVAEGKPARKPKPATITDGDDDIWYLHSNGKYSLHQREDANDVIMTRRSIRDHYGLKAEG